MTEEFKLLQLFYAGVLADSVNHFEKAGILEKVTETKFNQQQFAASAQLKQLGINSAEELFDRFSKIFGCIQWKVRADKERFIAMGESCLLCSISKKIGTAQPCYIYCINPFKSFAKALEPSLNLRVNETLWDGPKCEFELNRSL